MKNLICEWRSSMHGSVVILQATLSILMRGLHVEQVTHRAEQNSVQTEKPNRTESIRFNRFGFKIQLVRFDFNL